MMKFQKNVEIFTQILRFFENTPYEMADCGRSRPPAGFLPFNSDSPNHEVYSVSFACTYLFYSENESIVYISTKRIRFVGGVATPQSSSLSDFLRVPGSEFFCQLI